MPSGASGRGFSKSRIAGARDGGGLGKEGDGGNPRNLRKSKAGESVEEGGDTPFCIVSSYAGFSKKGYAPHHPRKHNQDALIMAEDVSTASLFLAVMDGHGEVGEKVAQAFRRGMVPSLFDHPDWQAAPELAVAECISTVERALLANASVDTSLSGTTYTSVCVRGTTLVLTNVGDSRATLGRLRAPAEEESAGESGGKRRKGWLVAQALTKDHKPDIPAEKERILRAGGRIFSLEYSDGVDGPPRVWLANTSMPGLAMSRTLGDVVAHSVGVISDPDTYRCNLTCQGQGLQGSAKGSVAEENPAVLILATDGLWEFISDQEAVDIASQCSEPRHAVQRLTQEATNRWMKEEQVVDDITVCVAFLKGRVDDCL